MNYNEALREAASVFVNNELPIPESLIREINKAVRNPRAGSSEIVDFIEWLKENTYYIPEQVSAEHLCKVYEEGRNEKE